MSQSSSDLPAPTGGDFILYTAPDGAVKVDVFFKNETVWLTQKMLAQLFGVKRPAITKHLRNIFATGELAENSVCSILEHTAGDGKIYSAKYYNLDAIIAQYNFFILKVVKAWIDPRRKLPRTIHHQGEGVFAVPGRTLKLPSPKTSFLT